MSMPQTTLWRRRFLPALVLAAAALGGEPPAAPEKKADPPRAYRLSGPFSHDNLTIFLIHGDDQVKGKTFLTLDEALEQKMAVVHETKNVNELSVENLSETEEVFIQAGDIVKGGQQDRTLAFDMIVPPRSGKVPLKSFCVEAGRWNRRGAEEVARFGSSKDGLYCNSLKLAARKGMSQQEVWENVAKGQGMLSRNVQAPVQAGASASSLQLTLEHKKVLEAVEAYVKKIQASPKDKKDVIGYAVCINGKVNNADVYASHGLFLKLWPKLLKASAVEAVAEKNDKKFDPATEKAVQTFLADAEKGKKTEMEVNKRLKQSQCENEKTCLFETSDRDQKGAAVRRSYISK
jgi:hypothetical protein